VIGVLLVLVLVGSVTCSILAARGAAEE